MNIPIINKYIDILRGQQNNLILAPCGHLGVSRNEMPQIDSKYRKDFITFMKNNKVKVREIRVPAKSLKMVQGEYNRDKVGAIMASGNTEGDPIFVSSDGFVIDGNHRLIAHLNMPKQSSYISVAELGMPAKELLELIHQYPNVRYRNLNGDNKG